MLKKLLNRKMLIIVIVVLFVVSIGIIFYVRAKNEESIEILTKKDENSEIDNRNDQNDEEPEIESGNNADTGIEHTINNSVSNYDSLYKKRGVYIEEQNSSYFYYIAMGEKSTGGYGIIIKDVNIDEELNVEVIVKETSPEISDIVTMAFTYPVCMIEFKEKPNSIVVKNKSGEEFNHINF